MTSPAGRLRAFATLTLVVLCQASASAQTLPIPAPPAVDDPQLAPLPVAPRVLQSWDDALTQVRMQSPDLRATIDNVVRAEAQIRVALSNVLPNANAQISFAHQFVTSREPVSGPDVVYPLQDVWGVGWNLLWPIGSAQAWYARDTAAQAAAVAQLDLGEKRRMIAQAVVGTMLGTLAAQRVAELNRVGLRAALERLALTKSRTALGSGTALDVERAEQDVAAARALVITGDEALRQTWESLGLALGSTTPVAAPGSLDVVDFEKAVAGTCRVSDDVEKRPDVQAARARVALADRGIQNVWLSFAPTFLLESQFLWNSQVLYGPNTNWDVAAVLNVPIWDGGARYGQLRDAHAAADQARTALTAARLNALVQIAQSMRAVTVSVASRDVAQQQRDLAYSIDQRTREGYTHGLGTSLDLVTSAQALRQAEINLALLQFQTSQARVLSVLSNAECVY
jgi:outer membrane protein TolC